MQICLRVNKDDQIVCLMNPPAKKKPIDFDRD